MRVRLPTVQIPEVGYTGGMEHFLRDGAQVRVRPIRPDDKAALSAGLDELSDLSVHRRFLSPKPSFSRAELRYLTEVDGHDHLAFVAETSDGDPAGVARWVRLADDPETAEAAIVVADPLQGRGLGSLLAELLADEAVRHGVRRFTATMLSDNLPAHRLMTRLAAHLDRRHAGSGADELVVELAAA